MAIYNPPNEILPIFNPNNWIEDNSTGISQSSADRRYLKLSGGTETGLVNFNQGLRSLSTVSVGSFPPTLASIDLQGDFNQEFGDLGTTQKITGRNMILTNSLSSPDPFIFQLIRSNASNAMTVDDSGNVIINGNTINVNATTNRVGINKVPVNHTLEVDGGVDINSGHAYRINNVSVLNSTTLGSGVVSSSLTSVGTLNNCTVSTTGFLRPSRTIQNSIFEITSTPYTITIGNLFSKYLMRLSTNSVVNLPPATDLTSDYNGLEINIINCPITVGLGTITVNAGSGTTIQKTAASTTIGANESRGLWLMYDRTATNWIYLTRFS